MYEIYSDYIEAIYKDCPWGYSLPYFLTAVHDCNPEFAHYYGFEKKIPIKIIARILSNLKEKDKVIFSKETADSYLESQLESVV
jgi:4-hydroxy 2-oxovalerate aldolase